MKLELKKAYDYYVANITESCNKTILPRANFDQMFSAWITVLAHNTGTKHVPILTNCGNSRWVDVEGLINRINSQQ